MLRDMIADAEIRQALRSWLLVKHAEDADTVLIDELGVCGGQVRIDLAVINSLFHGYEIKSNRDDLRRLGGQVNLYSKVLDRATIVVGDRHLIETLNNVPRWWGVLVIESGQKGLRFKTVRRGRHNPRRDPRSLVELLWRDAAIALLAQRNATHGILGKPRWVVWDRVCEYFEVSEIAAAVRALLKARGAPLALARLP